MPPLTDFVLDGQPHGDVASQLAEIGYNSGVYRPYIDANGNRCVDVNVGMQYDPTKGRMVSTIEKMTFNEARRRGFSAPTLDNVSNATVLRKDEWITFDTKVLKATRQRLRAWSDLAANNTFTVNGMASEVMEWETMNDPGEARVDMETTTEGRVDVPAFQLEGIPLPITQSDFWFSERKLAISRSKGQPLNTLMAEVAGRRVAERIEKFTLGVGTSFTFGTSTNRLRAPTIYGYTSHPDRNTKVVSTPTGSNSATTVSEVLAMRSVLYADGFFGPFVVYNGTDWDQFLDDDHFRLVTQGAAAPITTLRERLMRIRDIADVRRADYLSPTETGGTFDLIMVSLSNAEVARAVIGMPLRTVQWPTQGGMRLNFKVMTIMVPQIRSDFNGNSGIMHGQVT
jgi:hypothetical protein